MSIGLAFLAGLASFLSPCVFPLVPAYISYLGGRMASGGSEEVTPSRWTTLLHGLAFVAGFSTVFIVFGILIAFLGGLLVSARVWIARIGGVLIAIFGVHLTGLFRIPFLEYDLRKQTTAPRVKNLWTSFLMGIFFSAGWSPCVGPILGSIYTLTWVNGSIAEGFVYLTSYSLGLAIPFIAMALGMQGLSGLISKLRKATRYIEIAMGVILIVVGVLLSLGVFQQLARLGSWFDLGL